jgi:cytochrome c5
VDAHDPHQSFIKTPQQLIVVILLAFLVPIIGIILLVQLVLNVSKPDPRALTPEAVAERIQPVARLEFGAGGGAAGGAAAGRTADQIVKTTCAACHQAGVANAPKFGDTAAWAPRIKTGLNALVQSVIKGKGAMPPKAGDASLTEAEIQSAVALMANQAGAKFKEKPAAAPVKTAAAPAADGKAVYDKICVACHQISVAGSPKLGDKAAWAPRLPAGIDGLTQSVIKGKNAMPPKAGNPALSDAEIRAAVEFMVSQAK